MTIEDLRSSVASFRASIQAALRRRPARYPRPALTPEQVEILRHVGAGVALFGLMFAGLALALAL